MEEKGWVTYQDKELLPPAVLDKAPGSESSHQLPWAVLHPPVLASWDNRYDYGMLYSIPSPWWWRKCLVRNRPLNDDDSMTQGDLWKSLFDHLQLLSSSSSNDVVGNVEVAKERDGRDWNSINVLLNTVQKVPRHHAENTLLSIFSICSPKSGTQRSPFF